MIQKIFIVIFLLLCISFCQAQLQANFTIDKPSGCSPLEVRFTNSTSGASASVTYSWDLGNGNSSTLVDPAATYSLEGPYTVTLTATDGGIKSTISKTITVYKKPVVDFNSNPVIGCVPFKANFTSMVSPGDGTVASYLWDFGDGTTISGKDIATASHVYTVPQKPPLSLTVVNSYGCYTTVDKPNLLTVLNAVEANYNASETFLCKAGSAVNFTNTSTGDGTLSYLWDFGDGQSSVLASPSHKYDTIGSFIVRLSAKNDAGCTSNAKTAIVNVGIFKAGFDFPAATCVGQALRFKNTTSRPYDSVRWKVNGVSIQPNNTGDIFYKFNSSGTYPVKLTAYYKNCVDVITKTVTVGTPPPLKGFLVRTDSSCSLPITFTFTDTTAGAVKWVWRYLNNSQVLDTSQSASHAYTQSGIDNIGLSVTNQTGCTSSTIKTIAFNNIDVAVIIKKSSTPAPSENRGCPGLAVTFSTTPAKEVVSFLWNLGDGTTSTKPEPTYVYNQLGSYSVSLDYVTKSGCHGTVHFDSIYVSNILPFDFGVSPDTVICGNSAVTFTPTVALPNRDYIWFINGKQALYSLTSSPFVHHFQDTGLYTIALVVQSGTCRDTVKKINYIRVLPPFPEITSVLNTCDGARGLVTFTDSTHDTNNWSWDFGDGNTLNYGSFQPTIKHTYSQTGNYQVILTATRGNCTISDSVVAHVLLKQKPVLAGDITRVCTSESPMISLSNLEPNPVVDTLQPYQIKNLQFGDLSFSNATVNTGPWNTSFQATVSGLETDKNDLRIITSSNYFNCQDTSNYIPLKITGPIAGFSFAPVNCFKQTVVLKDTSHFSKGIPIVKWEWFFGDSTSLVATNGNSVTHKYPHPGSFQVKLRVTDASGCSFETPEDSIHRINLTGPIASFAASDTNVLVNATVNFTNTSQFYENSELLWKFSDGSVSTDDEPSFLFAKEGNQKVMLITRNLASNCTDTSQLVISVKRIQSLFTYDISYTDVNNCPPVIVNFKSGSVNADRVRWVFGDGGEAGNQMEVSHVYTNAGIFRVVHYSYDAAGRSDSLVKFFEVKGPYATLKADTTFACNTLEVKLSADTVNAASFNWDFGDGNVIMGTDTFATHTYVSPGVYIPALLLTDKNGCTSSSLFSRKIIIDSLSVSIKASPSLLVCDSSHVTFSSAVYSLSKQKFNSRLQYNWVSDMHPSETYYTTSAAWNFNKPGLHRVTLGITSPYGCKTTQTEVVDVKPGVTAGINAPSLVCAGDSIFLKGNTIPIADSLIWHWKFPNGTADVQNPPAQTFTNAGPQSVSLIVSNGYCMDTASYVFDVYDNPVLNLTASKPYTCENDTAMLVASGGSSIKWMPAVYSFTNGGYTAVVKPASTTTYIAVVTDSVGCKSMDSIEMKVVKPFKISVKSPVFTCLGTPIQLSASGGAIYKWTANGFTSSEASPVINPTASDTYKLVCEDGFNCFSDSANVIVQVGALPQINAGPDKKLIAGQQVTLTTTSSNDVIKWNWQPGEYLQCTNCPSPVAKPETDINYVVTVTNDLGCLASDTVRIEMVCGKELVYIPTGFTPNGDNLNDRFAIHGSGIHINRVAIFDRWGKVIFERKDVSPHDRNSSWDGSYNGTPLPGGSYVYMLEVICNSGEKFTFKGTITLIR